MPNESLSTKAAQTKPREGRAPPRAKMRGMKHLCYVPASFVVLAVMFVSSAGRCAEPYSHLEWRQIGPAISGGRVSATAGTDADPFLYYVGAADGGVFKTIDAGGTGEGRFEQKPG